MWAPLARASLRSMVCGHVPWPRGARRAASIACMWASRAFGVPQPFAQGDTGQSRRVADFLLAWWNAASCGAFDLTTLWGLDTSIAKDMVTVFGLVAKVNQYPDSLGYEEPFKRIVREWRPEL